MLPFTSLIFFLSSFLVIGIVYLFKKPFAKVVPYEYLLFAICVLFALFIYPHPLRLGGFVLYSYIAVYVLNKYFPNLHRLVGSLIIALPLLLIKTKSVMGLLEFAGASYMTFRTIQVYIDFSQLQKDFSFTRFVSFLTFIPTLLVGPIDRYQRFTADLKSGYNQLNKINLISGWNLMLLGLIQKYILAEIVSRYWLDPINSDSTAVADMVNCMFAYSVFLYFDFAGYSHMAMGLGYMAGIKVPENFNQPYLSVNPQDFWHRWHISLGDWLRDYFFRPVYKELSTKKKLKSFPLLKQNVALFLTFTLMGTWNGFKSYYIASGMLLGTYSVIHNSYVFYSKKNGVDVLAKLPKPVTKVLSIIIMIVAVSFALYIFSGRFPYLN